jgi:hypothetical protein
MCGCPAEPAPARVLAASCPASCHDGVLAHDYDAPGFEGVEKRLELDFCLPAGAGARSGACGGGLPIRRRRSAPVCLCGLRRRPRLRGR